MEPFSQPSRMGTGTTEGYLQGDFAIHPLFLSACAVDGVDSSASDSLHYSIGPDDPCQVAEYPRFPNAGDFVFQEPEDSFLLGCQDTPSLGADPYPDFSQVPQSLYSQPQRSDGIGKRRRDDELAEPSLPTHDTVIKRRNHKEPSTTTMPRRSSDRYKIENQFQFRAVPINKDLEHVGGWSTSPFPILAASPTLDFPTNVAQSMTNNLTEAALAQVEGHDLRPKKRSRRDSPATNLARSQSLEVKAVPEGSNQSKTSLLACPFYKKDGQKYHDCLKYELRRVKDVKQHIFRKHAKHEFSCTRCSKGFSKKEEKEHHERGCQEEPVDGSSGWQRKDLNVTNIRGCTTEEQWFSTWDTVFPDHPRPKSCYLGSNLEEMMSQIRDLWDRKKDTIIDNVINEGNKSMDDPSLLESTMQRVFNQFQFEMSTSNFETKAQKQLRVAATPQQKGEGANLMTNTSGYQVHATEVEQSSQEEWIQVSYADLQSFDESQYCEEDGFLKAGEFTFEPSSIV